MFIRLQVCLLSKITSQTVIISSHHLHILAVSQENSHLKQQMLQSVQMKLTGIYELNQRESNSLRYQECSVIEMNKYVSFILFLLPLV